MTLEHRQLSNGSDGLQKTAKAEIYLRLTNCDSDGAAERIEKNGGSESDDDAGLGALFGDDNEIENPYDTGTRKHRVFEIIDEYPHEWLTAVEVGEKLDTEGLSSSGAELASTYLSTMAGETLEKRVASDNGYEYRIAQIND